MQEVLHYLNQAVSQFHNIPAGFWQALIASGVLSPLIKIWKHFRITKKEKEIAEWAMYGLTIVVAFAVAVFQYLLTTHPQNPQIIALHTAVLSFMLQPVYMFVVKPTWNYLSSKNAAAAAFNSEVKSAAIPAEGLPIGGTSASATSATTVDQTASDGF